jgi:hypothetical protein
VNELQPKTVIDRTASIKVTREAHGQLGELTVLIEERPDQLSRPGLSETVERLIREAHALEQEAAELRAKSVSRQLHGASGGDPS